MIIQVAHTARSATVTVEFKLVGTAFGREITVAHSWACPAVPEDKARLQEWCEHNIARLLEGKAGEGAPIFKPQRLRELLGGFEGIERGMRMMEVGAIAMRSSYLGLRDDRLSVGQPQDLQRHARWSGTC